MSRTTHHKVNHHVGEDFGAKYNCNKGYAQPYGKEGRKLAAKERREKSKTEIIKEIDNNA
jgi:hypothetical protein